MMNIVQMIINLISARLNFRSYTINDMMKRVQGGDYKASRWLAMGSISSEDISLISNNIAVTTTTKTVGHLVSPGCDFFLRDSTLILRDFIVFFY